MAKLHLRRRLPLITGTDTDATGIHSGQAMEGTVASQAQQSSWNVPMLDLAAQYGTIREEIRTAIDRVLNAQHFILGPEVEALEREVAAYCGRRFGVGVASGTDAIILALSVAGIGPGDEVIVPSFSFIATADAVSALGATPVFVDIQRDTFSLDPRKLETRITARTKAVVPVHLYGQAADMDPVLEIARKHGLLVVEDNAQGIGATYKGRKTAAMGDLGCISFFPSKNLGAYGDGGMVVTDSEPWAARLKALRAHGSTKKYLSEMQGWNSRLDELQAAILRVKLGHLDAWNSARRCNAQEYTSRLDHAAGIEPPAPCRWGDHVYHQYTVRVANRDQVQAQFKTKGVSTMVYYPVPIHLQPIYQTLGYRTGDLPETEAAAKEVLSLPIYPELSLPQIDYVTKTLIEAVRV